MNTNSNVYTIIYTTVIVVIVAAVLAFASSSLKDRQTANQKAEIIGQILTAAQFEDTSIDSYKAEIESAVLVDLEGNVVGELDCADAQVYTVSDLKKQNYGIADKSADTKLPVYIFKNGTKVVPVYGAGLWGPVWGYIAVASDGKIAGATFDHDSETPGLGGKIKDDPSFSAQFAGKAFNYADTTPFAIVKGGAGNRENAIDAITGATMTSNGLGAAINTWAAAYEPVLAAVKNCCCGNGECDGTCCGEAAAEECCQDKTVEE